MEKHYIIPVIGQTYFNRSGGEYRCTDNRSYENEERMQRALLLGEHWASMVRVKDGWSLIAHGVLQYADGTIEWNYSADGRFPRKTQFCRSHGGI